MPSDAKKRDQQRKKDAQKKRSNKIITVTSTKPSENETNGTNGVTNGEPVELTEEGKLFRSISYHFICQRQHTKKLKLVFFFFSFQFRNIMCKIGRRSQNKC